MGTHVFKHIQLKLVKMKQYETERVKYEKD